MRTLNWNHSRWAELLFNWKLSSPLQIFKHTVIVLCAGACYNIVNEALRNDCKENQYGH